MSDKPSGGVPPNTGSSPKEANNGQKLTPSSSPKGTTENIVHNDTGGVIFISSTTTNMSHKNI